MTITIALTEEEESRLREQATLEGLDPQQYVANALRGLLRQSGPERKVAALRSLLDDDEEEQRETGEYLLRALDEDRVSTRKLFQ